MNPKDTQQYIEVVKAFESTYKLGGTEFINILKSAASTLSVKITPNTCDEKICVEIVERYNKDIKRIMVSSLPAGPDIFKQAGYLAFWIRKLKPLRPTPSRRDSLFHINEVCAFVAGLALIRREYPDSDLDGFGRTKAQRRRSLIEFTEHIIYNLRYGQLSPTVISLIFYAACNVQPKRPNEAI